MDIKINVTNEGKKYFMYLEGYLDYGTSGEFDSKMKEILPKADSIIVDMEKLEYISSAGIRVIVYAYNELEDKGGLKVKNLNSVVEEIFEVTGLDDFIEKN